MTVALLGPQNVEPTVGPLLRELGIKGPVAVITAGWQERESEENLVPKLGTKAVNLTLHARADDIFRRDPELSAAYKDRQTRLRLMQDFYRIRLDHADQAARAISVRHVHATLLAAERAASVQVVRQLDRDHLDRCYDVLASFDERWKLEERKSVQKHRKELTKLLAPTEAVIIAGGHVAVLLNRLLLFDILPLVGDRAIIAWSAGAMALCEHVVLFHDDPPQGQGVAEVLGEGLGVVQGIVALPNARARLRLDDEERVALFAQRFAKAACVAMDHGAKMMVEDGRVVTGANLQRLRADGTIDREWP